MSKRANPMRVKAALTYTIEEAALVLGKTPATIRNWVKDGLIVMSSQKPCLISGAAIREYLQVKYKAAKSPLSPRELFCPACKVGREPVEMLVTLSVLNSKTPLLRGSCSHCSATATRIISARKLSEFGLIFHIKESVHNEAY